MLDNLSERKLNNDEVLLTVNDLSVTTNQDIKLLKNINFEIYRGEIVSIVGLSGSGKSLTCKAILRLLNPRSFTTKGSVHFNNKNLLNLKKRELRQIRGNDICIIMQNPSTAFSPITKVGKQMIETVRIHKRIGKTKCEKLLRQSLEEFNLGDLDIVFNSYPHTLSGGMLQRLMIGLALTLEPSIIIADEITSSIDATVKKAILDKLSIIKSKGISILFVSHDMKEVNYISDRVVVIEDGYLLEGGESISDYCSRLVQDV